MDISDIEEQWLKSYNSALTGAVGAAERDDDGDIDEDECAEIAAASADASITLWLERFHPESQKSKKRGKRLQDDDFDEEDDFVIPKEEPESVPPTRPRGRRK